MFARASALLIVFTAAALAACSASNPVSDSDSSSAHTPSTSAELVLKNAAVYTVDAARSWAQAVAIRGDKIVYVGSDKGADALIGKNTKVIDLHGKMVLPGFQDVHIHPVHSGVTYQQCALFDLNSIKELVDKVEKCANDHPEWKWIRGGGWLVDNFAPSGLPDKKLLDAVVPDRPVSLKSSDGHSLWVNSKALEVAGIDTTTADPEGGRIDRYADSKEPSGSLQEDVAMMLVMAKEPTLTPEEMEDGLRYALKQLNGYGITAVQDAIVKLKPGDPYYGFPAYHALDKRGELSLRVVAAMFWEHEQGIAEQVTRFIEARQQHSHGNVHASAIKIWQDGVIETQTAALLEPYLDRDDGYKGELTNPVSVLNEAVTQLDKTGFQIHFHAIGDAATRSALDAVELAQHVNGKRDARHHISHLEMIDPADIPRFNELGVIANFQPLWSIKDAYITELTLPRIGAERGKWLYPIGSVMNSGAMVAFGSDWYVSSANPLAGIEAAVTRLDPWGNTSEPLTPEQRISLADAITNYTIRSAYVNFLDDKTGSIEIGKLADIIVLDKNLFRIPLADISETSVVATLFGGKVVAGKLDD